MMNTLTFNHYYRYDELVRVLESYAETYPHLVRLETIGQSYEKRDLWLVTVTCWETGLASEKPALWVDGNIHSIELAPSVACVYFLETLVKGYEQDPDITRCLKTRAFYICPRVNPDGAELALADSPQFLRSGTRFYPHSDVDSPGLVAEDIDGDGRILMMRIPDGNGTWKVCPNDPRLMIPREPTEVGGEYYRLLPEGKIDQYDGVLIPIKPLKQRLDFNRNFPVCWREEGEQQGAGDYPASEPEVRAVVDFITQHSNITGAVSFHTMSGVLLRPYSHQDDEHFPHQDLTIYQKIAKKGTDLTGYPAVSVYHGFRQHHESYVTGAFDDWCYEGQGLFAWTVEIWSPQQQAGITDYDYVKWYEEHPLEDDLKLLAWNDEVLGGKGYIPWYEFEHPQLGMVELGGWDEVYFWRNPPHELLEKEVSRFPGWLVWHLLISPLLDFYEVKVQRVGSEVFLLRVVVQNTGWLPTYITQKGRGKTQVQGCIVALTLPEGASLELGERTVNVGYLEGRADKPSAPFGRVGDETSDRAKVEWMIRAPLGGVVEVMAKCDRAGVVRKPLELL
ncbi:carboxypeptidase [Spirulina subsalsa FACHB-351]|uniref:Carboxypeptidase n=1 Tax=Spirulina subsalsa FACHB-351 TaxID=234711 RepID=A0ABT3L8Z5_9CYAN|nr:M14 family metallopeptidase [Spirulina subsalsa]MCW6037435.1 carboxypeptidase [Spirulina subsalsa FACHB-351]